MRTVVTGAAGFIGSHLSERLLSDGHDVVGIDALTEYYDRQWKERNLRGLLSHPRFQLVEEDILTCDLRERLDGCDFVFHLAGQPGVRSSWGDDFRVYVERNIWATQRLLEAARESSIQKLVFASSSSVYGNAERYPTVESDLPRPISPYGVSKLSGEYLCLAYASGHGVPVMVLRYFTVYGPRQRPDMAFNRFIAAMTEGRPIVVYGDGLQTRDFTFVSDAVEATAQAGYCGTTGEILNIGGGSRVTVRDVLAILGEIMRSEPRIDFQGIQRGDVRDTAADVSRARAVLGYAPMVSLREGLRRQAEYACEMRATENERDGEGNYTSS